LSFAVVLVSAGIDFFLVAVFRIWDENNVDNILMFSVVARQSSIFQLLMLAEPARYMGI